MEILKAANLALRFVIELCALAGLAWWGAGTGSFVAVNVILGVAVPLAVAFLWGSLVAPRATRRLPDPERLALEVLVFAAAGLALAAAGAVLLGAALFALAFANALLVRAWGGEPEPPPR